VGLARPGDKLKIELWRDKKRVSETVALGRADKDVQEASAAPQGAQLGLALRPLQPQELRGSGLDGGLLIERVSGPAQLAGVQPGDVLLALNGKPVQSVDQVRAAMKDSPKSVALLVARDGQQIFVPVRIG
jgi:serine protease Do